MNDNQYTLKQTSPARPDIHTDKYKVTQSIGSIQESTALSMCLLLMMINVSINAHHLQIQRLFERSEGVKEYLETCNRCNGVSPQVSALKLLDLSSSNFKEFISFYTCTRDFDAATREARQQKVTNFRSHSPGPSISLAPACSIPTYVSRI